MYNVEKLKWMPAYTQWMKGGRSNTYRLRDQKQLPQVHHLECRCADCRAPASCQRVGIAWWEEVCPTVAGVGAPPKDMSGARVTALGLECGIYARARASELYNSDREFWAVHTDSTCPAQVEKSNLQLECRLWVWSRASARTPICTTALRFRHRTMSKQAVHTNSKCPAQMGNLNIKLECRRAGCTMLRNSNGCPHTLSG